MVKSVNFRGYKTPSARRRRAQREGSAIVEAMRFVGMSDEEITTELVKARAVQVSTRTLNGNTYVADLWHGCREDAMAAHWQLTEQGKRAFFTEVFPHRPVTLPSGVRHTGGWAVWVLRDDEEEPNAARIVARDILDGTAW